MSEEYFEVKGMHCASCSNIIARKLSKLNGVNLCEINYATEKAKIIYEPNIISLENFNNEIKKLGYKLLPFKRESSSDNDLDKIENQLFFALPAAAFSVYMMIEDVIKPMHMNLFLDISMLTISTLILLWVGFPYLKGAFNFFRYGKANMDTLVGIGTITAYIYSIFVFLSSDIQRFLNTHHTYFDVTIVVIAFITLGKYLEARSKYKTNDAISKLLNLQAKTALVERDNIEFEIPINEVIVNDVIIVKPGQKIPVDGIIIQGNSSINESMITGEAMPVDKTIDNKVTGATLNKQGIFKFKATSVGKDTILSQIIKTVEQAQGSKASIQKLADKISEYFVPGILISSLFVFFVWIIIGINFSTFEKTLPLAILSFVGILVIACPCALGLATPIGIIAGIGKGAKNGILIKSAESIERLNKVNFIVFDKTGTITKGEPQVTDIIACDNEIEILQLIASLERYSEHPLGLAVKQYFEKNSNDYFKVNDFENIEGKGVKGKIGRKIYYAGNLKLAEDLNMKIDNEIINKLTEQGKTPVVFFDLKEVLAYIGIADTLKDNIKEVVADLHKKNFKVAMLTGDHTKTAVAIGKEINIDNIISEVLPHEKASKIKEIQDQGYKVAMIGDGINDAPALTVADVGIAMGSGTDIAIESADIVLLGGNIAKLPQALKISKQTMRVIKQNLFWAFFYNIIGIPVAAGILYPFTGTFLNPAIAGFAMATSSVTVVLNALRLKILKI